MMKKLLFAACAVFFAASAGAVEKGDYIFSHTAKYKVTGDNLVTNGTFTVGDGSEGWTNENGEPFSASWKVVTNDVINGWNAIESQGASTTEGDGLANKWKLGSGLYAITYYVYTPTDITCTITDGGTNYVNFFANTTGDNTIERAISGTESWKGEQWTQVVDTIFVNADEEYLVFNANNIAEGVRFTGFELRQVNEVYDSRIIDRTIEYAEKLLQEPDLANGREDFEAIVAMMKEAIADPASIEDKDAALALVYGFNEAFDEFMNNNGGNTVGTTGDWTQIESKGFKGLTTFGAWKFEGGRWGFSANDGNLGLPMEDGYAAGSGIQTQWDQVWPAYIESTGLERGKKYFFSIEAKVIPGSSTQIGDNPPYGEDYNTLTLGGENYKMFIGTDTLTLEGDTLSGYYWKRYYMISEIPADADAVRAGWIYHFPIGFAKAARAYLRNPEFRLLGKTEVQINYEATVKDVVIQQNELGNRLVNYPADVAAYKWEKDSLTRAIDHATPIYDASFQVVENDGGCSLDVTEENVELLKELYQSLLDEVNALGRAKNYVIAQNVIFGQVQDAIDAAKVVLADDLYQDGDKATFEKAISDTQIILDSVFEVTTDATRENDELALNISIEALSQATDAFKASANLKPIVDIDFSNTFTAVEDAEDTYVLNGAAGQMVFAEGAVDPDNTTGAIKYMLGYNGENNDVLRVGNTDATVEIPAVGDDEVLRISFDFYFGKLTKKYVSVDLRNNADERVAGFTYNCYEETSEYNDFNNEGNTGMAINQYATGIGSKGNDNAVIYAENNKTSFELIVDYKSHILKGIITNPQKGTCNGEAVPFPAVEDTKVTKFVLSSIYNNADRRCWFDNLKAYKYKSTGAANGIDEIAATKAADKAVYNLQGVKMNGKNLPAGLYIVNGKKYVIK
ncbi:MAG: hypothetical protein K6D37_12400 [Prevotella sp.]|nr:hypothetical protein [Prevotella sp.]